MLGAQISISFENSNQEGKKMNIKCLLTIIVPVYNEEQILNDVVPEILSLCKSNEWKVIFINDGSSDNSGKYLEELIIGSTFAQVIHHKVNRGYGGALKSGIQYADTPYLVTIDADGQHNPTDIQNIFTYAIQTDADMVIGNRGLDGKLGIYRSIGKFLIRTFAQLLMPLPVTDLNSGFKLYRTDLVKKYVVLCPNSMSFSDVITLIFIKQRDLVLEQNIKIRERKKGKSTINTYTAFETVLEILNIVLLFSPLRVFLPLSLFLILIGVGWGTGVYIVVGRGVSVGAMLAIVTGLIFFVLGLLANQISAMRMERLE